MECPGLKDDFYYTTSFGKPHEDEENHMTRKVMNINVEGWRGRGRPKKDGLTV
jgi:hypothetical protein